MFDKKRMLMAAGTGVCALGVGVLMQFGKADGRTAPEPMRTMPAQTPFSAPKAPNGLKITEIALTSAVPDIEPTPALGLPMARLAQVNTQADILPSTPSDPSTPALSCAVDARAETRAGAMVALIIDGPCLSNERVMIHHNGLMFTDVLQDNGALEVLVPALAENAVFIIQFQGGQAAVAMSEVPSIRFYDRVAVQWAGEAGFELHAREFGAGYGESGHVWAGAARDVSSAAMGDAGFVTLLGREDTHEPHMAHVYSFPASAATKSGTISVSVEAEITEANCGRDVAAQTFHVHAGEVQTRDLSMTIPACDAVGDFLVLNNLIEDLKIAAN